MIVTLVSYLVISHLAEHGAGQDGDVEIVGDEEGEDQGQRAGLEEAGAPGAGHLQEHAAGEGKKEAGAELERAVAAFKYSGGKKSRLSFQGGKAARDGLPKEIY